MLTPWAAYGLFAVCTLITYSRIPPHHLYHVQHGGLAGGLGRTLVLLNFSTALVAVPLAALSAKGPRERAVAVVAIVLCSATPFVVHQRNLDARWVNAVPAVGVLIALALTLRHLPRAPRGWGRVVRSDRLRIALVVVLVILAIPWLAASVGVHFGAGIFLTERLWAHPNEPPAPAVHLGWHHGLDGLLLMSSALVLTRRRVPVVLALYLAIMFAYGAINFANDIWLEQVVKRGWTDWAIPDALVPSISWIWLVILGFGFALWPVFRRQPSA